jgi:hypothetical protein
MYARSGGQGTLGDLWVLLRGLPIGGGELEPARRVTL